MKQELSVLIPVFNHDCTTLASALSRQLAQLTVRGVRCELVVADDGSTDASALAANGRIALLPLCRYIAGRVNVGRAAIRNFLASQAHYRWLLFIDCDMTLADDSLLERYLADEGHDVVYGGYVVGQGNDACLRYAYERANAYEHTAERRTQRPYQHFHTANFMVSREVMLAHPFDESFRNYGYEDVLFGKQLRQAAITIAHVDNPVVFGSFEDNAHFVAKTEEGLRTLHDKRHLLRGYSRLLTVVEGIHLAPVRWLVRLWHWLFGSWERRWLCSSHPSLRVFKIYKIGYYLSLKN